MTKQPLSLTVASLLTAALFSIHLAHDFIYGLDAMSRGETFTYLAIVLLLSYGTIELAGRRAGYIIILIGGVLGAALPVLHTVGGPRAAKLGFWFVWVLLALGASGIFSIAVSTRELFRSFRQARVPS